MKKKLIFRWVLIVLVSFVLVSAIVLKIKMQKTLAKQKLRAKLASEVMRIDKIELSQIEKSLGISVEVVGRSSDRYNLKILLNSIGYVQMEVMSIENEIELKHEKQGFSFLISFEELSEYYRQGLLGYIPKFKRRFLIDEILQIEAMLTLVEKEGYSKKDIESVALMSPKTEAIARFAFSCLEDKCVVDQSKE